MQTKTITSAVIFFFFVFALAFVLGGWFLMPCLPPVPVHPVSALEWDYWKTNWAGAVLGVMFGSLSVWSIKRKSRLRR